MNAIEWTIPLRFLVALALGFLVGLERESTKIEHRKLVFGGVRTHPLISLFGFGCAWFHSIGSPFVLPSGLLLLGALAVVSFLTKIRMEQYGTTSEISAFLTFVVGALALLADIWVAMALGIVNAFLLSEKAKLETYVEHLDRVEFLATLKFLLVTVIVLPVLPDQEYTRFRLNPTRIWEIVILVSTIGFVGYFLAKKLGPKVGLWLSGLLGGIVSSTAVAIAAGRIAQREPVRSTGALQASLLASSMMYLRILVLLAVLGPAFAALLWWKMVLLSLIGLALAFTVPAQEDQGGEEGPRLQNPFEVTPALLFAAVFVVLLVITEIVRSSLGEAGMIGLSLLVGVADVDPFILSLVHAPGGATTAASVAMLLAVMSNTLAKGTYFAVLARTVRRGTVWRYGLWALLHIPLLLLPS